jgi:hypothetical protein
MASAEVNKLIITYELSLVEIEEGFFVRARLEPVGLFAETIVFSTKKEACDRLDKLDRWLQGKIEGSSGIFD